MNDTKMCTKCLEMKPFGEFSKQKGGRYGLRSACRLCIAEYNKRRLPGASYSASYHRAYYAANREAIRARQRVRQHDNPDWHSEKQARRRSRKAGNAHEPYSRTEIFARWSGKCCYCDDLATALDHVAPIVKGGADAAWNLVPACATCNSSKGGKSLADWAMTFAKILSELDKESANAR